MWEEMGAISKDAMTFLKAATVFYVCFFNEVTGN